MRTSYSALNTFKTCGLKYKFQEIDKIKAPKSKEAVFGTIVHNTLKFMHQAKPILPTIEKVLEYYNDLWNSNVYEDKQEEMAALSEGVSILQNYYKNNNPRNFNIVSLETRFNLNVKDITIAGIIDRIDQLDDGSFEIIDYKTTKSLPSQKEVDNDFQLSIYQMAVLNRWPNLARPIKSSLYFLKHGIKLSTIKTPEQIEKTKQYILDIVNEINKGEFIPTPSPLCDWCGYQQYCPMFKHKFQDNTENNSVDIKTVLEKYYKLKLESKRISKEIALLQKAINDYCDSEKIERVFGDGIYATRVLQRIYSYDKEKVKSILEPIGKWDDVISIDEAKLKKVVLTLSYKEKRDIENSRKLKKEFKRMNLKKDKG